MPTVETAPCRRVPPIRKPGPKRVPAGAISEMEVYPINLFMALTGWSKGALATARRAGLRVIVAGGRRFVLGRDFVSYLDRLGNGEI
jgi:hypothetical protein